MECGLRRGWVAEAFLCDLGLGQQDAGVGGVEWQSMPGTGLG